MKAIRNRDYPHKRFIVLLGILLTLIFVRYSLQTDIPRMIFVAIIVLIALLGDREEILTICVCCIPLHESIDLFFSLVFIIAIYVFKYFSSIRIHLDAFVVLAMVFWELLHCIWQDFSMPKYITDIVPLIVLVVIMSADLADFDYAFMSRTFAATTLCTFGTLLVRVFYFTGFDIAKAISGLYRLGSESHRIGGESELVGGTMNPNTLGIIGVLAITVLMQLRLKNKGNKADLVVCGLLMVFGTLTASRTYLVCLVLMGLMLILCQEGDILRKIKFIIKIALIVLAVLLILQLIFPSLLRYYIGRFMVSDITTGRDTLMVAYNEFLVSNPVIMLLGIGLQNYSTRLISQYRVSIVVPHNSIQELIIAWGLPGVVLFCMLLWCMKKSSARYCRKHRLTNYVPLIILLVKGLAGQMLNSSYTMLAFSLAYISMCQDFSQQKSKEEKQSVKDIYRKCNG